MGDTPKGKWTGVPSLEVLFGKRLSRSLLPVALDLLKHFPKPRSHSAQTTLRSSQRSTYQMRCLLIISQCAIVLGFNRCLKSLSRILKNTWKYGYKIRIPLKGRLNSGGRPLSFIHTLVKINYDNNISEI